MEYFNHQQHAVQVYLQLDFEAASSSLYLTICPMVSLKVMSCYKCGMWILFGISFAKEYPWAEHLTRLLKEGGDRSFKCFRISHTHVVFQLLDTLEANNCTNNGAASGFEYQ